MMDCIVTVHHLNTIKVNIKYVLDQVLDFLGAFLVVVEVALVVAAA